jgi:hypothetical protein
MVDTFKQPSFNEVVNSNDYNLDQSDHKVSFSRLCTGIMVSMLLVTKTLLPH